MDSENGTDILGPKKLNYDFLLLVRDKKYAQALVIGKKILETDPNNPSVKKFCDFILSHNKQLQKMVQQQKQEEQYEQVDSDDEEQQEEGEQEGEGQKKEESSDEDEEKSEDQQQDEQEEQQQPKEQKEEKPKPKVQLRTCTLNQIPHICTRDHNQS